MLDKGQITRGAMARLVVPPPQEAEHVLQVWRMTGGKLNWQDVLIGADLHQGDPELLIEGLMVVRDEAARWRSEESRKS